MEFSEWVLGEPVKEMADYLDSITPVEKKPMVIRGFNRVMIVFTAMGFIGGSLIVSLLGVLLWLVLK